MATQVAASGPRPSRSKAPSRSSLRTAMMQAQAQARTSISRHHRINSNRRHNNPNASRCLRTAVNNYASILCNHPPDLLVTTTDQVPQPSQVLLSEVLIRGCRRFPTVRPTHSLLQSARLAKTVTQIAFPRWTISVCLHSWIQVATNMTLALLSQRILPFHTSAFSIHHTPIVLTRTRPSRQQPKMPHD